MWHLFRDFDKGGMKNFNMVIQECLKRNVIGRGKQNKEKVEVRFF